MAHDTTASALFERLTSSDFVDREAGELPRPAAGPIAARTKAELTTEAAMALIDADTEARANKTAQLRAARLARDAAGPVKAKKK